MGNKFSRVFLYLLVNFLLAMFLTACSQNKTAQADGPVGSESKLTTIDSLEKYNRKIYSFNVGLDKYLLKPIAKSYKAVTPDFVDTSISNFFSNMKDVSNVVNNLLQFKIDDAINDTERFIVNSTIGFGGLLDVASAAGLEKHDEDFGQTLATWGIGSGPYLMLPFFGPSTIRDLGDKFTIGTLTDLTSYSNDSFYYFMLDKLDTRADLLGDEQAFENISEDKYVALRDAWLQQREYLITDGQSAADSGVDLIDELESLDDL